MKQTTSETFGKIITDEQASQYFGFIYLIEINGRKYLGKKSFNLGVNWRTYKSSNKTIQNLLKTNEGTFTIIEFAKTKRYLTYAECKWQMKYEVLEDDSFENANVLGKFYRNVRD